MRRTGIKPKPKRVEKVKPIQPRVEKKAETKVVAGSQSLPRSVRKDKGTTGIRPTGPRGVPRATLSAVEKALSAGTRTICDDCPTCEREWERQVPLTKNDIVREFGITYEQVRTIERNMKGK